MHGLRAAREEPAPRGLFLYGVMFFKHFKVDPAGK